MEDESLLQPPPFSFVADKDEQAALSPKYHELDSKKQQEELRLAQKAYLLEKFGEYHSQFVDFIKELS